MEVYETWKVFFSLKMLAIFQLILFLITLCLIRSVLMLKKKYFTLLVIMSASPFPLPFSHQLYNLLLWGEKRFFQHANFATEQAYLYLIKGRLPPMWR